MWAMWDAQQASEEMVDDRKKAIQELVKNQQPLVMEDLDPKLKPLWGHDIGKSENPAWGWLLPHPARPDLWSLVHITNVEDNDKEVPPPLGPRPAWVQNPEGLWGWAIWQAGWYRDKTAQRPWIHLVYVEGPTEPMLAKPGIDDVGIPEMWKSTYGWTGPTGLLDMDALQPQRGSELPKVQGLPISMVSHQNKNKSNGGPNAHHQRRAGNWQVMSATLRKEFRPGQSKWRPGRMNQNMTNLENTKISKYVRNKESKETPGAVRSQMAWQVRQRNLPRDRLLSIEELERMGYCLPNFENVRERLTKDMVMEEGEEDYAESLEQSADEPTPNQRMKRMRFPDPKGPNSPQHATWARRNQLMEALKTMPDQWLNEEEAAPFAGPTVKLTEDKAAMARAWYAATSPPSIVRMVKRPEWQAEALMADEGGIYDPLKLTMRQWDDVMAKSAEQIYAPAVDRRWPGYVTQPWFITEGEVDTALQEDRISRDYARQCKKTLRLYGNCLNGTRRKMYGLEEFTVMMVTRTGDLGESSTPERPAVNKNANTEVSPMKLDTVDGETDEDNTHPDTA